MTPADEIAREIAQCMADAEITAGTLYPKARVKRWHVIHVNCDCASYNHARLRPLRGATPTQMRCILCKKALGDMEVQYHGYAYAARPSDAVGIALRRPRPSPCATLPSIGE